MARRRDDSATEPVIRVLATERAMEILIDSQTLRQRLWYSARLYGVHSGSVSSPSAYKRGIVSFFISVPLNNKRKCSREAIKYLKGSDGVDALRQL